MVSERISIAPTIYTCLSGLSTDIAKREESTFTRRFVETKEEINERTKIRLRDSLTKAKSETNKRQTFLDSQQLITG